MDVEVGSNLYRNTDGTVEIEGVPLLEIALRPANKDLLVTFALFDAQGKMRAKLVDSTLMFNEQRAYEVTKAASKVSLVHTESRNVVLQIELKPQDVVAFTKGKFHTMKGRLLEVSPTEWVIEKQRASGTTQDMLGGSVKIG